MSSCPCHCKLRAELAEPTVSLHVNKLWTSSRAPASLRGCSRQLILISGSVAKPREVSYAVTNEGSPCPASPEPQVSLSHIFQLFKVFENVQGHGVPCLRLWFII